MHGEVLREVFSKVERNARSFDFLFYAHTQGVIIDEALRRPHQSLSYVGKARTNVTSACNSKSRGGTSSYLDRDASFVECIKSFAKARVFFINVNKENA